jgi:uncharacterized membrane protein YjfL (UPF0719 family)
MGGGVTGKQQLRLFEKVTEHTERGWIPEDCLGIAMAMNGMIDM